MIEEWNRLSAEYALRGALCASSPRGGTLDPIDCQGMGSLRRTCTSVHAPSGPNAN